MFGDGSYRDTLSVLEKVLISSGADKNKKLDVDTVARIVGAPTHDLINSVLRAIENDDISEGLLSFQKADENHVEMKVYLKMLLQKLRAVLLLRYAPTSETVLADEFTPDDLAFLKTLAVSEKKRINSHVLSQFLSASRDIGYSAIASLPLELALIRVFGEGKEVTRTG